MNDNLLIAAVLREVAELLDFNQAHDSYLPDLFRKRAAELDPPEKNEKPV
jgi:hypothetical protein